MLRNLMIAVAFGLCAPLAAQAQPQAIGGPTELADGFFRALQTGEAAKAYHDIWIGTFMAKKQPEVDNVASQTTFALKTYGKVLGWELVSEKAITPSFLERVYLVRTEALPLFFRMQFYKPVAKWQVGSLYFTDNYKTVE